MAERARAEQIVAEFLVKSAALVSEARSAPEGERSGRGDDRPSHAYNTTDTRVARSKTNRWFNLHVDERDAVRAGLEAQHAVQPGSSVRLLVRLVDADDGGPLDGTPLELWTIHHATASPPASPQRGPGGLVGGRQEVPVVYKRAVVMLRSLYCLLRALPAHHLFRACQVSCPVLQPAQRSAHDTPVLHSPTNPHNTLPSRLEVTVTGRVWTVGFCDEPHRTRT
jgi:hypothetical protein